MKISGEPTRQPHAVLDLPSRHWKALKIECLLELDRCTGPLRLREVGTESGGIAHYYLAVPNSWMLVEPHFRLVFLSWLPRSFRGPFVRLARKGDVYDSEPLQLPQLERLLRAAGFHYRNLWLEALRATFDIERPDSSATALLRRVPDALIRTFSRTIPTLIYRCGRADHAGAATSRRAPAPSDATAGN